MFGVNVFVALKFEDHHCIIFAVFIIYILCVKLSRLRTTLKKFPIYDTLVRVRFNIRTCVSILS